MKLSLETVSDELNKQLAGLAAKLGVSVEHLWGVLVRQAYIDGLSSLVTVFCCAAAGVGVLWFFVYRRRKYKLTAEPKERFFFSTTEPLEYMVAHYGSPKVHDSQRWHILNVDAIAEIIL